MDCPPEIASIALRIIGAGVLQIRACAFPQDTGRCAAEADHIHNLPDLVLNYSPSKLSYYWLVERPSYIELAGASDLTAFGSLWDELRAHAESPAVLHAV